MPTHSGPIAFTILLRTTPQNLNTAYNNVKDAAKRPPEGVQIHSVGKAFGAYDMVVWGTAEDIGALTTLQTNHISRWNEIERTETIVSTEFTPPVFKG